MPAKLLGLIIIATLHTLASRADSAGGNAQSSGPGQRARKLDEATGEDGFKSKLPGQLSASQRCPASATIRPALMALAPRRAAEKVSLDLKIRIMKARQAKGMTQKELATKMSEKPQVVNQYESGQAVPNNQVLGKMERILGVKLRGAPGPVGGKKKKKK